VALITPKIDGVLFCSPCGSCRQVMSEFMSPDTPLLLAVLDGNTRKVYRKKLKDFMPYPFDKFKEK